MGALDDAAAQVSRGNEVSAGEDWCGLGGHLARAQAAVAAAAHKFDEAEAGFESAVTIFQKYTLPWEEAETLQRWGRALLATGAADRAIEKFDSAIEIYRRHGAGQRWIDRVMADMPNASDAGRPAASGAVIGETVCMFQREGEYWTLSYQGKTSRLRDSKGMRYLAELLRRPGDEIRSLDLAERIAGADHNGDAEPGGVEIEDFARSGAWRADPGDAGEMLDAQAKAAYQRRLTELRDEIDEAREFKDEERAARAQEEIEALAHELKGAVGLAGRDRRAASASERARIAVTHAIRLAIDKISENDPVLGRLLAAAIKTGIACSYVSDGSLPIAWRL
jgi:tetratricopeptide (TPR) repeat protein